MRLLLSAQGEIKSKASIIIYHGGEGGEERIKGGSHGFQGNRGEKQSLLTRHKGGGGLQNIACQWRGSSKYYKALEGEAQG